MSAADQEQAARVGYSPPAWSCPPKHKFYFEVRRGLFTLCLCFALLHLHQPRGIRVHAFLFLLFQVLKGGVISDTIPVDTKPHYFIGRNADMCDIPFEHASVSRLHLVLQYKDNGEATLFDPGSTHGCRLNKKPLAKAEYIRLHVGDVIEVAHSSRLLVFCGPEELRPQGQGQSSRDASQPDKMQAIQAKREAAIAAYHAAQQKKAAQEKKEEASAEADWGFESDAEEDDEAVCDGIEILTAALRFRESGQLKEKHWPQVEKLERKKHRIDNIKTENKRIRAKEEKGQELSNTQREQLMRNEKAIEELAQQIDEGAEMLYSTVLRYLMVDEAAGSDDQEGEGMTAEEKEKMRLGIGAWGKNKQVKQRASGRDSDDEDSYFNRAGAAKPKPAAKGVISYESACADVVAAQQRVRDLQHELQKLDAHDKEMGVVQSSDSVDDFLVQMKLDEAARQRKQLMAQVQRARSDCERLEKLKVKLQPITISDDQLNGVAVPAPAPESSASSNASSQPTAADVASSVAAVPLSSTSSQPSNFKPPKKKPIAPSLSIAALLKGNASVKASFKEDAERRVQREQEEAATAAAAALAAPKTAEVVAHVEPGVLEAGRELLPNGEIVITEKVRFFLLRRHAVLARALCRSLSCVAHSWAQFVAVFV
jgi:hypothetical protein